MTGRSRGFAFATYATDDKAAEAIERFNGQDFDGRRLNVNEAEERPQRGRSMGGGPPPGDDFGGGGFGGGARKPFKAKGSRRGLRARKRSL
jgi:RNA recognition motif-containing protein